MPLSRFSVFSGPNNILVQTLFGLLLCIFLVHPTPLSPTLEVPQQNDRCMACFYQRNAHLPYIVRRALHESGPDENETFGHCFVCLRCPQPGNEEIIPWCRGWWPSDPDGGDYEADDGEIQSDEDEAWDHVDCLPLNEVEAMRLKSFAYGYATENQYQVLNQGGRSCLGYCSDVADALGIPYNLNLGDYTIPGAMQFPSASWSEQQSMLESPESHINRLWKDSFEPAP